MSGTHRQELRRLIMEMTDAQLARFLTLASVGADAPGGPCAGNPIHTNPNIIPKEVCLTDQACVSIRRSVKRIWYGFALYQSLPLHKGALGASAPKA